MTHTIYLGLGGNIGDRITNLERALARLAAVVHVTALSPLYETAPWGVTDQPAFLNLVARAETQASPHLLFARCKQIERELGRAPGGLRYGPRPIDIDILLYDDLVLDEPTDRHPLALTIPHPRMSERGFVMRPLADIAPALRLPGGGADAHEIATALGTADWRPIAEHLTIPTSQSATPPPAHPVTFDWGRRTYVMGIINITPDSFSGDGVGAGAVAAREAVLQGLAFVEAGADILDVGGESTRPRSAPVTAAEEQARVLPVLRGLRAVLPHVTLSVDSYRADTARAALAAGADWINDIGGLNFDDEMADVAAAAGCPLVIMHNGRHRALPNSDGSYYGNFAYDDVIADVCGELNASVAKAQAAGVQRANIILDPGIGFGKTVEQNLLLLRQLAALKALGFPLLLGTSRKGFIGHVLGGLPADERLEGTAATVALGIAQGADIVRVHDVAAMVRVARMADAIVRAELRTVQGS